MSLIQELRELVLRQLTAYRIQKELKELKTRQGQSLERCTKGKLDWETWDELDSLAERRAELSSKLKVERFI